jgi:hypothetical protein
LDIQILTPRGEDWGSDQLCRESSLVLLAVRVVTDDREIGGGIRVPGYPQDCTQDEGAATNCEGDQLGGGLHQQDLQNTRQPV